MSFWDNHKDSIKAGGISVLKGAGKATKAVSKAGYSAYKNHNSKSNAAPSEEQDSHQVEEGYMPAARDDPKSFPPPPKHVAAYGTQGASHMVQQQQQYQPHMAAQSQPPNLVDYNNPYHQPPQQQQQHDQPLQVQYPSQQQYSVNVQPQTQSLPPRDQNYSGYQQPSVNPAYPPPPPRGVDTSTNQLSLSTSAPAPPPPPARDQSYPGYQQPVQQPVQYSRQPTYQYQQQHINVAYPHTPSGEVQQSPYQQSIQSVEHQQPPPPLREQTCSSYQQPSVVPGSIQSSATQAQQPLYLQANHHHQQQQQQQPPMVEQQLANFQQQYQPISAPGTSTTSLNTYQVPNTSVPSPPVRTPVYPGGVEGGNTEGTRSTSFSEESTLPHGEAKITEPKFKTNLMEFDITKFGAPPPRARLTKDEDAYMTRKKQEAERLKQIKEASLQKARESTSKSIESFKSNTRANSLTPNASITPEPTPDPAQGVLHALDSEPSVAKPFSLPEISQIQPPPPMHRNSEIGMKRAVPPPPYRQKSTSGKTDSPPMLNMVAPEPVGVSETSQNVLSYPISNQPASLSAREPMKTPSPLEQNTSSASMTQAQAQIQQGYSCRQEDAPKTDTVKKKTPPAKPTKPNQLKQKPPKPVKPSSLASAVPSSDTGNQKPPIAPKSSAHGNHIKELQAKLGNLNFA